MHHPRHVESYGANRLARLGLWDELALEFHRSSRTTGDPSRKCCELGLLAQRRA